MWGELDMIKVDKYFYYKFSIKLFGLSSVMCVAYVTI